MAFVLSYCPTFLFQSFLLPMCFIFFASLSNPLISLHFFLNIFSKSYNIPMKTLLLFALVSSSLRLVQFSNLNFFSFIPNMFLNSVTAIFFGFFKKSYSYFFFYYLTSFKIFLFSFKIVGYKWNLSCEHTFLLQEYYSVSCYSLPCNFV